MTASVPPVPTAAAPAGWPAWLGQIARAVNLLLRGKDNSTASLTLLPSATSTVLIDDRIGGFSVVVLEAQTASAAAARSGGLYVVSQSGQALIYHPSDAAVDMTFGVVIRS